MKINLDLLPKWMFLFSVTVFIYAYGVISHRYELFPVPQLMGAVEDLKLVMDEASTMTSLQPSHFLQPARREGAGVTINRYPPQNGDLILMSGFIEGNNGLQLIRRDGQVVNRWTAIFSELVPSLSHITEPPATDWNIDTHGALALPDGSVVFNFEYGGLIKLNRCGDLDWALAEMTHHSVERAEGGGFWVPGRRHHPAATESKFPPFETPFDEDTILKVSDAGKVLEEISVPGLFYRSGLEALLTAGGEAIYKGRIWDQELVHLNKVAELNSSLAPSFPMFDAGDLLLSIRNLNLVLVVDPRNETIKWWQTGPWLRQHDPEFTANGRLLVFNNNTFRTAYTSRHGAVADSVNPLVNNIMEFDPGSGEHKVIYGNRVGEEMFTVVRGKHEITPGGGLLITEFEGGRVFEIDESGDIVWEYINRYDEESLAEVSEARVYPHDYFTVLDWSCDHL